MIKNSRFSYVKYDAKHETLSSKIRTEFENLEVLLLDLGQNREASLAVTKLEEAFMWAGKAIRNSQISTAQTE